MKNSRLFGLILTLLILSVSAHTRAQQITKTEKRKECGSISHYPIDHPLYERTEQKRKENDERIDDFLKNQPKEVINGIITIPVVFHIIHKGETIGVNSNLADSQIDDQLEQLNDDFRRTNSDAGNTLSGWSGVWADTEIEFCLASHDPIGYQTSGINRYLGSEFSFIELDACMSDTDIDAWVKPETIWDPERYLNIWVSYDLCGLFGYATFPDYGPEDEQGVVLDYKTVGSLSYPNLAPIIGSDNRRKGRTLTHEVGHYLNLYHTFQGGCNDGDLIVDTPPLDEPNWGCDLTYVSCGGYLDMAQNYMGYADDDCQNLFTQGQKTRMNAALQVLRPDLMNEPCGPPIRENDLCVDATVVYSCNTYSGNTLGATSTGTGPSCSAGASGPGVWYIMPADGSTYTVSTCETATFDTVIEIYTGSCGALSCHAANDQACTGGTSEVTFDTVSGQSYYIYVSGYFTTSSGLFELNIYKNRPITSTYTAGPGTLRDAIECAPSGAVITIPNSFHNQTFNISNTILIERDVTIEGSNGANIEIDGSDSDQSTFKFVGENLTLRNLTFTNGGSESNGWGGAVRSHGNTDIIDCDFEYNGTKEDGGAVVVTSANTFNLINCNFAHNEAFGEWGDGGAVWSDALYNTFVNNTFVNNAAGYNGGALYFEEPIIDITLINNTIANNVAADRGGGILTESTIDNFHSNILGGNVAGEKGPNIYSYNNTNISNASNNLIQDTSHANISTGFIEADPLFENSLNNDYSLSELSPCIDAGNSSMLPVDVFDIDLDGDTSETIPLDVEGNTRLLNQSVDMGAIERILGACEIDTSAPCNTNTTVNLDAALVNLSCGVTYTSAIFAFTFNYENPVSFTLSGYSGNKAMYLYDDLCNTTCISVAFSNNSSSSTQSISYTLLAGVTYYLEIYDASQTGGNANLLLSCLGEACSTDLYLTSPADDVINGIEDFYTNEKIFATNHISETGDSYFICGPDGNDYIELSPGFEVIEGGRFQTFRFGCDNSSLSIPDGEASLKTARYRSAEKTERGQSGDNSENKISDKQSKGSRKEIIYPRVDQSAGRDIIEPDNSKR